MSKKILIDKICDYVLSAGNERDDLIDCIYYAIKEHGGSLTKKGKINIAEDTADNHIWYVAAQLYYGKREAKKELKDLISEALDEK